MFLWRSMPPRLLGQLVIAAAAALIKPKRPAAIPLGKAGRRPVSPDPAGVAPAPTGSPKTRF